MRNRKGFTLMELLLVVAVLAIVAAAAAPTFFGGATEAMNEARKSSFMAAYTNASSAANMNAALYATGAKGAVVTEPTIAQLMENSPLDTRIFTNNAGKFGLIFAEYNKTKKSIEVKYTALTDTRPTGEGTAGTAITDVSAAWTTVSTATTGS